MKIAVVGKGGSGKSTVSWSLLHQVGAKGRALLAIDADYNLDLARLCKVKPLPTLLQTAEADFYEYQGLKAGDLYVDLPLRTDLRHFSLRPADPFTEKYSCPLSFPSSDNTACFMAVGGAHTAMLFGTRCSHAYFAPCKYYLPLLDLPEDGVVVVDSVAGVDMVAYGLVLGVDLVLSVVEPTAQSLAVNEEVRRITAQFGVPHLVVGNKVTASSRSAHVEALHGLSPLSILPHDDAIADGDFVNARPSFLSALETLLNGLDTHERTSVTPWQRHSLWRQQSDQYLRTLQS